MEHLKGKNYVPWHLDDPTEIRQLTLWTSLWVSSMCKEFMTYRHLRKAFHTKDQDRQTWKGTPAAAEAGRGQKERWLPSVSREKRPWDAATREARRRATGERNRWNGTTNPAKPTGDWQEFRKQIKTQRKKETIKETIPKVEKKKKSQNMNFHIIRINRVPDTVSFHYRLWRC